jgi:NAD(P)-dependent dehydrogenase (short-subunit alcohol dehydrogenase family)
MDLGLRGKVAIVTGGSRGIGRSVAEHFLAEGAAVAICARDRARLDETVAQLGARGEAFGALADVADGAQVEGFVDAVGKRFGHIDILVNNAGTHIRATVETTTEELLLRQLREKLFGFFSMTRAAVPAMRARGKGAVVNIIGQAARHPHPDRFPSGVTNAALVALTKSMADAYAREGIRVNSVCPQYIRTELLDSLIAKEQRDRGVDAATAAAGFTRANALGRLGEPDEVADLTVFLASERAKFVCGSSVSIDGGYHRYVFG